MNILNRLKPIYRLTRDIIQYKRIYESIGSVAGSVLILRRADGCLVETLKRAKNPDSTDSYIWLGSDGDIYKSIAEGFIQS